MNDSNEALKRAQESFKKRPGRVVPTYEVEARVTREKTAQLKALRLAKEAADKTGEATTKPGQPNKSR